MEHDTPLPALGVAFGLEEAAVMALRIEDAVSTFTDLLDGADASTPPGDFKRRTLIILARDRIRYLQCIGRRPRGNS